MSLMDAFNIAATGMSAQAVRMNVTSSNMANADSASSSTGETYRARHPVFQTIMDDFGFDEPEQNGGVRVAGVIESRAPLRVEYQPENPLADAEGYVYFPNVNVIEEMANMIAASRSYQSNVEVANTAKEMTLRTLSLGQ